MDQNSILENTGHFYFFLLVQCVHKECIIFGEKVGAFFSLLFDFPLVELLFYYIFLFLTVYPSSGKGYPKDIDLGQTYYIGLNLFWKAILKYAECFFIYKIKFCCFAFAANFAATLVTTAFKILKHFLCYFKTVSKFQYYCDLQNFVLA